MKKGENMAKVYDPAGVEKRLYKEWEDKGYFKGKIDPKKKPFTIVIPPPNIVKSIIYKPTVFPASRYSRGNTMAIPNQMIKARQARTPPMEMIFSNRLFLLALAT